MGGRLLTEEEAKRQIAQLKEMVSGEQSEVASASLPARHRVSGFTAPHCGIPSRV